MVYSTYTRSSQASNSLIITKHRLQNDMESLSSSAPYTVICIFEAELSVYGKYHKRERLFECDICGIIFPDWINRVKLEKKRMTLMSVEESFQIEATITFTIGYILERSPTNAMSVEKRSVSRAV